MKCGWNIYSKSKKFESIAEMVQWCRAYLENHPEKYPDKKVIMVGWNSKNGKPILQSISAWEESVISQIQYSSKYFEELKYIEEIC